MDIEEWASTHGQVVHRTELLRAGFRPGDLAGLERVNRSWFATRSAPDPLVRAALLGGRATCVTAVRAYALPLLHAPVAVHLWVPRSASAAERAGLVLHWREPLVPVPRHQLHQAVHDVLQHVADCLPFEEALVVWEGAANAGRPSLAELRPVPWRGRARLLAAATGALSDSLLETLVAARLRDAGVAFVQQARVHGSRVDFLVAGRLVVQTDGLEFHQRQQRERDLRDDARLLVDGIPVLRLSYADVVEQWPTSFARIQSLLARAPLV